MDTVSAAICSALGPAPEMARRRYCVALSGGLDSTVLLHAMAGLCPGRLRALHVNHQLHADAGEWVQRCGELCARLGVPFSAISVTVDLDSGDGPEGAARRARYLALAAAMQPGEILLTAHHQDDLAETLLINLLRGSGPAGLAGIPEQAQLGPAGLQRPLLGLPRAELAEYARRAGLDWVEDPANLDPRMDRNFLRHQIIPALQDRWPAARATIGRSAILSSEAVQLIDELAALDTRRVQRRGRIMVAALKALPEARQRNLLRHVCRRQLGSAPPWARLQEGLSQLIHADEDRSPLLAWPGGEIRRYRGALYVMHPLADAAACAGLSIPARGGARLDLGEGAGRLRLVRARGRGLACGRLGPVLSVRYREGGERMVPVGAAHSRELKKLLQEHGVVPWMRERIPLLYSGGELVAVAGLWLSAAAAASGTEPGLRVRWEDHPAIS